MPRASNPARAAAILLAIGAASCGPGALTDNLARAPEFDPKGQAKCGVAKSQAEPLIVEWPDAARGKLESQVRRGVVAVRYIGCEMQVLGQCTAPGKYGYASLNPKKSRVKIRNADELYASIPAYAVKFEGTLARAGELNVEMTIVGRYEADRGGVRVEDLSGDCDGATHVVTGLSVGAFEFFAGADARAGVGASAGDVGAGAKSVSSRETLNADGQEEACRKAAAADTIPPYGCGALLGLEVQPIVGAQPAAAPRPEPELARAPTTTSATGTRFARDVDKRTVRDSSTGLLWTYTRILGTHDEAVRSCTRMTDPRYAAATPGLDASFLGQDAAPAPGNGWRLPTAGELQAYLPQATSQGIIKLDDGDCLWAGDDDSGAIARRQLLGQAAPARTCVTRTGARRKAADDGSFFCVKGR
jgi:hypothetical protein